MPLSPRPRWRAPRARDERAEVCDVCGERVVGEAAGRGLLVFPRGDGLRIEEPPLCEPCAHAIGMSALHRFAEEEEEG